MISVSSGQLDAWLAAFMFPLARILGLFSTGPIFSNIGIPQNVRVLVGIAITLAIVPTLPAMPATPAASWVGLAILVQQVVIGALLGISLRIAFVAVELAGDLIGLQMGLSFAVFYDPTNSGQTAVVTEFFSLLAVLLFLSLNGHLLMLSLLAQSFTLLPVSIVPFAAKGYSVLLAWATTMFVAGVLLSLPLIAALLIANIAMGVLSRVAPQLNLFAVGFPVTIVAGFVVVAISLPYFAAALANLYEQGFTAMTVIMKAGGV